MTSRTIAFYEQYELLAHVPADSESSEINSGRVNVENYQEIIILISVGDIAGGGTFDCDIEQANAATGGTLKAISGKSITQLVAADDDKALCLRIRTDELDVDNSFHWINAEFTPATGVEFAAFVFGGVASYEPVPTTNWEEIVD